MRCTIDDCAVFRECARVIERQREEIADLLAFARGYPLENRRKESCFADLFFETGIDAYEVMARHRVRRDASGSYSSPYLETSLTKE
jgi:hypothetical protein